MQVKPLTGIKVIDLSRLLPGPMCTLHLADMGADVIKVEEITKGDYARSMPPVKKINSSFFLALNRNKRSMTLDLTKEEGKKVFLNLSRKTDVVVESFRPGVVHKLGIDYEAVKKDHPQIVYCSITGYGQTGPYRKKAGHDLNFCSYAGVLQGSPQEDKKPSIPNFQIADIAGGALNAVMSILAALVFQKTTGEGQYIDISLMDGTLAHSISALPQLENFKDANFNPDFLAGAFPCYNIYETTDKRFIALAAQEFKFWESFCRAIKRDDLIPLHTVSGDNAKKIYNELSTIFKTQTLEYWVNYFKDVDCCISPVLLPGEVVNNEQVVARNMVLKQEHPSEGTITQFGLPVKFSSFEFKIEKAAPLLGEHTDEILNDLGYTQDEIKDLKLKKVI